MPASGELTISAAGFESQNLHWTAAAKEMIVVLRPATVTSEVTVSANRINTRVTESATSVVILAPADLAATAALTTDDTLRQVPGFSLFRRSGSRTANPDHKACRCAGWVQAAPAAPWCWPTASLLTIPLAAGCIGTACRRELSAASKWRAAAFRTSMGQTRLEA